MVVAELEVVVSAVVAREVVSVERDDSAASVEMVLEEISVFVSSAAVVAVVPVRRVVDAVVSSVVDALKKMVDDSAADVSGAVVKVLVSSRAVIIELTDLHGPAKATPTAVGRRRKQ